MVGWWDGGMVGWWDDGMLGWWDGGMVGRRYGGMGVGPVSLAPGSVTGTFDQNKQPDAPSPTMEATDPVRRPQFRASLPDSKATKKGTVNSKLDMTHIMSNQ